MIDGLGYDTRIEHGIMEISHYAMIIGRGIKVCDLYMLNISIMINRASIPS